MLFCKIGEVVFPPQLIKYTSNLNRVFGYIVVTSIHMNTSAESTFF